MSEGGEERNNRPLFLLSFLIPERERERERQRQGGERYKERERERERARALYIKYFNFRDKIELDRPVQSTSAWWRTAAVTASAWPP